MGSARVDWGVSECGSGLFRSAEVDGCRGRCVLVRIYFLCGVSFAWARDNFFVVCVRYVGRMFEESSRHVSKAIPGDECDRTFIFANLSI